MNEYLKALLEQIRCKKARPYIRQELKDHMEDQIEANIQTGMSYECAEKEAVRDMGDPIETGISLDRIHRPQVAWKLLFLVILLSIAGILIHAVISNQIAGVDASASGRYALHVPVFLVFRLPALMTAGLMLISMLVMLTIAVWKDWFHVAKCKTIGALWGTFMGLPAVMIFVMYWGNIFASYQKERLQAFLPNSGTESYLTATVRKLLLSNKFVGSNGMNVAENLPGFNTDYILTGLSSMYGMIAAIIVCCVLTVLIFAVFHTAIKQKNQLGMMMGCGCGMVFLVSTLINILENIGAFPPTATFLPFVSAGGSYVVISYGLMGVVLSIYRYKNVYPRHVKINILND